MNTMSLNYISTTVPRHIAPSMCAMKSLVAAVTSGGFQRMGRCVGTSCNECDVNDMVCMCHSAVGHRWAMCGPLPSFV